MCIFTVTINLKLILLPLHLLSTDIASTFGWKMISRSHENSPPSHGVQQDHVLYRLPCLNWFGFTVLSLAKNSYLRTQNWYSHFCVVFLWRTLSSFGLWSPDRSALADDWPISTRQMIRKGADRLPDIAIGLPPQLSTRYKMSTITLAPPHFEGYRISTFFSSGSTKFSVILRNKLRISKARVPQRSVS